MKRSHLADKTGRSKFGPPYVALRLYMLDSPAWRALSPIAAKALIELMRLYKGYNNGQLAMAAATLADRLGCSKSHAGRALNELEEKRFIGVQKVGTFRRRDRLASEYFLTEFRNDVSFAPPTKEFMRWTPPPTVPKNRVSVPQVGRKQRAALTKATQNARWSERLQPRGSGTHTG